MKPMVTLCGDGNSQNLRIWSGFHPEAVDKPPLQWRHRQGAYPLTIGMHLALSSQGIIGHFFRKQREYHQSETKKIEQGF